MSHKRTEISFEWLGCLTALVIIILTMISLSIAIGFSIWIIKFISGV